MSPDCRFVRRVAAVVFVVLAGFGLVRFHPPLPSPLTLQIMLPADQPGEIEPIVITGVFGLGDFLFMRYVDQHTVVFAYDSWGVGGPTSPPVTVEPGTWHTLQIEMPSLANWREIFATDRSRLRLRFDGATLLDTETSFHRREPEQLYFAQNPISNNSNVSFHGMLRTPDGRPVRGTGGFHFSLVRDRLLGWVIHAPWQLVFAALLGVVAGFAVEAVVRWFRSRPAILTAPWSDRSAAGHRWFLATTALCALAFAAVSTSGTFRLIYPEVFSDFYEYQATSLLQGRLDVPPGVLSGEAFIVGGKNYGYFGVTPALLRIPFVVFDVGFGHLSRSFMLAGLVASLFAAYLLLRFVWQIARGPGTAPPIWAVVLLTLNAGLGSTLFFLSSRAFIYHEAILCGVTFGLFSSYCSLRYLAAPERRWWLGALICGTLAVHARPPTGLFALALLGTAAAVTLVRTWWSRPASSPAGKRPRWPAGCGRHFGIGLLSVFGVLSFNGLSYLKFKSFDGAPLKYHVQYNAARLARIDGKNFHLGNLHRNLDAYFLRPLWVFKPIFPFVYANDPAPRPYPGAKIDVGEPILGLPYAMPALFALAALGLTAVFWRHPALRPALLSLGLAAVPLTLALLTAVATSHRYTADFCPFLLGAAACGCLAVDDLTRRWRALVLALLGVLTVAAIYITVALTLHHQGESVWGVPDNVRQDYQKLRLRIDHLLHLPPHAPH
jgi:hypothetical protein